MLFSGLNFAVIGLCMTVWLAVSGVWYSPLLFNGALLKILGLPTRTSHFAARQWSLLPVAFLCVFALAVVIHWYVEAGGNGDWAAGAAIGILFWFGFAVPSGVMEMVYRDLKFAYFLIDATGLLAIFMIIGGLLGYWNSH